MAEEVNPPLVDEPIDEDIPVEKFYGKEKPTPEILEKFDLVDLAEEWVSKFNLLLDAGRKSKITNKDFEDVFVPHAGWKDQLTLSWDFHQYFGLKDLVNNLNKSLPTFSLKNVSVNKEADLKNNPEGVSISVIHPANKDSAVPIQWVQFLLKFENEFGYGAGVVRLVTVENTVKALAIYTGLENIKGNEEQIRSRRPEGVNHGQHKGRVSWLDKREEDFKWGGEKQPTVLIVGGGHSGLDVSARLKVMGVDSLIVEQNPRIGDNWRNRYKFLVLHDPVWLDHLPYLNFPDNWPIYTPKDKIAEWFESYVQTLELSFWTSKTVKGAKFDDLTKTWTVEIVDNQTKKVTVLNPKHLVMATGHSGEPNVPHFKDEDKFKGKIVHSSKHTTGKSYQGKNALVVGCCNSGHDIAHDFYEQGATPTLIQRSSTCILTVDKGAPILGKGLYEEGGPPTEIADLIGNSFNWKLQNLCMQQQTRQVSKIEDDLRSSLKKAGFRIDSGYGGTGLYGKYYRRGGGYYIDVGCSKLICDGSIGMKQGCEIERFIENGVVFTDGTKIDNVAIVVLATGYSNMRDTARRIFGDLVADRLNPVWGYDNEGEIATMWRDSGHPNFWYMGGNLTFARIYSKKLALKIIAAERGFT